MFSIGNEELESNEALGSSIKCTECGGVHEVEYGEEVLPDGSKKPSKLLAFYKCGDLIYLAGINGKSI